LPARSTHPGQEFVFVHAGEVELSHDGQVVRLNTGDCAYVDASAPHELRQVGDDRGVQAEVAVVAYDAPGRRD
jgi:quercetin dioxygenase-like cupin family protein